MFKDKKGIQLSEAAGAVLALVLTAMMVILGIYMISTIGSSTPSITQTKLNESGAFLNASGYVLGDYNSTQCNFANPAILTLQNSTSGVVIASGNYTLNGNTLVNRTAPIYNAVNVSYTYQWGGKTCQTAATTVSNFSNYPALVGLVGTIIFLGIVVGVLASVFMGIKKDGP